MRLPTLEPASNNMRTGRGKTIGMAKCLEPALAPLEPPSPTWGSPMVVQAPKEKSRGLLTAPRAPSSRAAPLAQLTVLARGTGGASRTQAKSKAARKGREKSSTAAKAFRVARHCLVHRHDACFFAPSQPSRPALAPNLLCEEDQSNRDDDDQGEKRSAKRNASVAAAPSPGGLLS